MKEIIIKKDDVLKHVYFIVKMLQNQNGSAMYGTLSGKSDYIGGTFDRFINTLPESLIFNRGILPEIKTKKKVEVITDFYFYDPVVAGIAPDVIGLKIDNKIRPFVVFDEGWKQVDDSPLIEIKTFKEKDYMVSLRNQNYDDKYLVMVESKFRVDYLLPFFDKNIFSKIVFDEMQMDDSSFIISDRENKISRITPVSNLNDEVGIVSLMKITRSDIFMSSSTKCEASVGIEWIKSIEEIEIKKHIIEQPLSLLADQTEIGLFRFNSNWYEDYDGTIPCRKTKKRDGTESITRYRTLDFFTDSIDSLIIVKKNKYDLILKANNDCSFNKVKLESGKYYKISYCLLDRSGSQNPEYFLQKDLIDKLPDYDDELKEKLFEIIEK